MIVVHLSRLEDLPAELSPFDLKPVVRVEVLDYQHQTGSFMVVEHRIEIVVRALNEAHQVVSVNLEEARVQVMRGDPDGAERWKTGFADANRRAQRIREWLEDLGFDVRSGTYDIGKDAQPIGATWDPEPWQRLSESLVIKPRIAGGGTAYCQRCGRDGHLDADTFRWLEHDDNDRPETVVILLCRRCSQAIVGPHPRLYRRLDRYEPAPGAMPLCDGCVFQNAGRGLRCTHPNLKAAGGPGLALTMPQPSQAFVDGVRGGRRTGWRQMIYHGPVTACAGRQERGPDA